MLAPNRFFRGIYLAAALLSLTGATAASACQYCEMAGALRGSRFGSSPAAVEVSPYDTPAPAATPVALTTPPPAASVVTRAGDLRPVALAVKAPVPVSAKPAPKAFPAHLADAGLLGLAAVGGVFCWRTRRKPSAGV